MKTDSRPQFFISYSRRDSNLVGPVVALLRASRAHVFRDADSLEPGKKWRDQLSEAISDAEVLVLFWCHHAVESSEVGNEYRDAIAKGKDVLPLLLDDTPLPESLAEYQYIDFRGAFPGGHNVIRATPAAAPPRKSAPGKWGAMAAGVLALIALPLYFLTYSTGTGDPPVVGDPPVIVLPAEQAMPVVPWLIAFILLSFGIFLWFRFRRLRVGSRRESLPAGPLGPASEHLMATTIEEELRRRMARR